jgi:hypothetical protein
MVFKLPLKGSVLFIYLEWVKSCFESCMILLGEQIDVANLETGGPKVDL